MQRRQKTVPSPACQQYIQSIHSVSTHPATGIYPSDYSSLPSSHTEPEPSTNSEDEYHVEFEPSKLQLPKKNRQRKRGIVGGGAAPEKAPNKSIHEHVLISQCIDRTTIDSEDSRRSESSVTPRYRRSSGETTQTSASASSPGFTNSGYTTYTEPKRIEFGNFFESIFNFFKNNPKLTKITLTALLIYAVICNLEIFLPRIITFLVRLLYPWCRYGTIVMEQIFNSLANMFTRLDGLIYATYCEFAVKNCRSRRLMCDVSCSFVDHVLSQSRPQLAPQPQQQ